VVRTPQPFHFTSAAPPLRCISCASLTNIPGSRMFFLHLNLKGVSISPQSFVILPSPAPDNNPSLLKFHWCIGWRVFLFIRRPLITVARRLRWMHAHFLHPVDCAAFFCGMLISSLTVIRTKTSLIEWIQRFGLSLLAPLHSHRPFRSELSGLNARFQRGGCQTSIVLASSQCVPFSHNILEF